MNAMNPYLKRAYGMTPTFHLGKNLIPALPAGEAGQGDDGTADRGDEHTRLAQTANYIQYCNIDSCLLNYL